MTMAEGLLSLSWNNHSATFCHALASLRAKERYADVTLSCEGKFYSVHKLVLSTCSEYFENIFEQTPCKHPIIVLSNIQQTELEAMLSYMYDGAVNVSQTNLPRLIKVAELLQIKGLAVPDEPPKSSSTPLLKRQSQDSSSGKNSPLSRTKSNRCSEISEAPQPKRIRRETDLTQDNLLESPASISNSQVQEDSIELVPEEKYDPCSETVAEAESESHTLASTQEESSPTTPADTVKLEMEVSDSFLEEESSITNPANTMNMEIEVCDGLQYPHGSDTPGTSSINISGMSQMYKNENPWPYLTNFFRFKRRQGDNILFECVQCAPLEKVISTSYRSKNNLKKHLKSKHSYCLNEFETCVKDARKTTKIKKQQSSHPTVQLQGKPDYDLPQHSGSVAQTVNLVVTDNAVDQSTIVFPSD